MATQALSPVSSAESLLVAKAPDGDCGAYAALVNRHASLALRMASLVTGDASDAEEAAQDGFVQAFHSLDRFRPDVRRRRPAALGVPLGTVKSRLARALERLEGVVAASGALDAG